MQINGNSVIVNGKNIFASPIAHEGDVRVALQIPVKIGNWSPADGALIVGTGQCCSGYFYACMTTTEYPGEKAHINSVCSIDFAVLDLMPVVLKDGKVVVIICGDGCNGRGVYMVGLDQVPVVTTIMDRGEYERYRKCYVTGRTEGGFYRSTLCLDSATKQISLVFRPQRGNRNLGEVDITTALSLVGIDWEATSKLNAVVEKTTA